MSTAGAGCLVRQSAQTRPILMGRLHNRPVGWVVHDAGQPLSPQAADLIHRIARGVLDEPADLMDPSACGHGGGAVRAAAARARGTGDLTAMDETLTIAVTARDTLIEAARAFEQVF